MTPNSRWAELASALRRPVVVAGIVGVLVIALIALIALIATIATGDPEGDLATEAPEVTSTTAFERMLREASTIPPERASDTIPQTTSSSSPRAGDRWTLDIPLPTTAAPIAPSPAPVRIPRPSCADGLGAPTAQTAPFTGLSASIPNDLPAVVVKVSNNNSSSRAALIGLDQADMVFEERIEASATRFAAVFHSRLPDNVGPVRSGRTTDIGILRNLGAPVLGYSGSNNGVAQQFRDAADNGWFVPYINTDSAPFARDARYTAPDNLFVDPTSLGACGKGGTPSPIFRFGAPSSTSAQPAASVALDARSPYRFDWSAAQNGWIRSQDGTPHMTRTGATLGPTNVVVLFARYVPSSIDKSSVDAETVGSGAAWILRDGTITVGTWSRPSFASRYTLSDGAGVETTLSPGSTWVVLAPTGSASWS